MLKIINKVISLSFYTLFFLVPLVLFHRTSELFEFNKMLLTYILSVIISLSWLAKMVIERKVLFRRTIMDKPLTVFLTSQILSTLVSIDPRTSILGYYSRFHGGLLSSFSYSILYWAFVSNMNYQKTLKSISIILASSLLVSIYAILEHFGIDKNIWVQDVQNRVFSTLGQPNWLAAWVVALIPLTWALALNPPKTFAKYKGSTPWVCLSLLLFLTLLYTKSRSGILGFVAADIAFWGLAFWIQISKKQGSVKILLKNLLLFNILFFVLILLTGTPWTPSIQKLLNGPHQTPLVENKVVAPALEVVATETSKIRKIVWKGAIDIWKNYPLLGSGVETFAFSYYKFRPAEHNLTSEWDFLYNKAHNEYLNFAATTGTLGLMAYLILIIFSLIQIFNFKFLTSKEIPMTKPRNLKSRNYLDQQSEMDNDYVRIGLFAGFTSILVTNFFGFSVVPVALQFFLYPAIAVGLNQESKIKNSEFTNEEKLTSPQISILLLLLLLTFYLLLLVSRYWYADFLYATGKSFYDSKDLLQAQKYLEGAVRLSPKEAIFWDKLSQVSTDIALLTEDKEISQSYIKKAEVEGRRAVSLSPANVNIKRSLSQNYIRLSQIDPNYLNLAKLTIEEALELAPTDAKLMYNLGLVYARLGDYQKSIEVLQKTIEIKRNYRNAYFALGQVYLETQQKGLAKRQFEFILENINPEDSETKRVLNELE